MRPECRSTSRSLHAHILVSHQLDRQRDEGRGRGNSKAWGGAAGVPRVELTVSSDGHGAGVDRSAADIAHHLRAAQITTVIVRRV